VTIGRLQRRFEYFDAYNYESYKLIRAEVVKTEKLISGKGFSTNDDIDSIIAEIEKDVEVLRNQLTFVLSEEHKEVVMAEVQEKKSAMQIEGKSVAERVLEFGKLNSLLAYHNRQETFKKTKKKAKDKGEESEMIALLEAEALAELMLLELLSL